MSIRKSYWQAMHIGSDGDREAILSWFCGVADGMTPYKAEMFCDVQTDREKKLRAFMTDENGDHYQCERTRGGRTFDVTMKKIAAPKNETCAVSAHSAA